MNMNALSSIEEEEEEEYGDDIIFDAEEDLRILLAPDKS